MTRAGRLFDRLPDSTSVKLATSLASLLLLAMNPSTAGAMRLCRPGPHRRADVVVAPSGQNPALGS